MEAVRILVLVAVLAASVWTDVRFRRIPNWLTVSTASAGLLMGLPGGGVGQYFWGLLAGFAGGFVLWLLKTFRAGDAKLFAALGALMGLRWLGSCAVWTFVCGAVLGLGLLLAKRQLGHRFRRLWTYCKLLLLRRSFTAYQPEEGTEREFPFAISVALGGILACVLPL